MTLPCAILVSLAVAVIVFTGVFALLLWFCAWLGGKSEPEEKAE